MQPFLKHNFLLIKKNGLNVQTDVIQTFPLPNLSLLIKKFLFESDNNSYNIEYFLYHYLLYLSKENGSCHNCYFTAEQSNVFK